MMEAIRPLRKQNFRHPDVVEKELEGVSGPDHEVRRAKFAELYARSHVSLTHANSYYQAMESIACETALWHDTVLKEGERRYIPLTLYQTMQVIALDIEKVHLDEYPISTFSTLTVDLVRDRGHKAKFLQSDIELLQAVLPRRTALYSNYNNTPGTETTRKDLKRIRNVEDFVANEWFLTMADNDAGLLRRFYEALRQLNPEPLISINYMVHDTSTSCRMPITLSYYEEDAAVYFDASRRLDRETTFITLRQK